MSRTISHRGRSLPSSLAVRRQCRRQGRARHPTRSRAARCRSRMGLARWRREGGRTLVRCAAYRGITRRATLLPSGATLDGDGNARPPPISPPRRYLYEPDGAVIRAHLVAEVAALVNGTLLDPTIAYITSDTLMATPFARAYTIERRDALQPQTAPRLSARARHRPRCHQEARLSPHARSAPERPPPLRRQPLHPLPHQSRRQAHRPHRTIGGGIEPRRREGHEGEKRRKKILFSLPHFAFFAPSRFKVPIRKRRGSWALLW